MSNKLDWRLRVAMMAHISLQLCEARKGYQLARDNLSHQMKRLNVAKKWFTADSSEVSDGRREVDRALRITNFARKRLLEAIRFAESELGKPKRQFFRPKKARRVELEVFEVAA